jgi:reticulon-4-interacting protein 1, mitochondrial
MVRSSARRPVVLESTVEVERSVADVWAYLRDIENYVEWFPGIVQMKGIGDLPPGAIGKRYAEIGLGPDGKEHAIDVEVVVADDVGHHLAIEASLKPVLPRFDYRLTEIGAGRTRFDWVCTGRASGPFAALGRQVMKRIVWPRLVEAMRNFKRILEANPEETMRSVVFRRFGSAAEATIVFPLAARPAAPGPGEVLVRQTASSVNPIDCHRRAGYGRNVMRARGALKFPVTLGVDICGEVVATGRGVAGLKAGDCVFGVKPPSSNGAFADYVVARADCLVVAPKTLGSEAAALPYAFLTAWSALVVDGGLTAANAHRKKVFVQGGVGGVGAMAVQLAKAWGAHVVASCSELKTDLVRALGADEVIARGAQRPAAVDEAFDIVLCAADASEQDALVSMLKRNAGGRYVSVIHPTLGLTDELGTLPGVLEARRRLGALNATLRRDGRSARWTLFKPHRAGLLAMADLAASGKLKPLIDGRYPLTQAADAQARLESGQATGKVLLDIAAPQPTERSGP